MHGAPRWPQVETAPHGGLLGGVVLLPEGALQKEGAIQFIQLNTDSGLNHKCQIMKFASPSDLEFEYESLPAGIFVGLTGLN